MNVYYASDCSKVIVREQSTLPTKNFLTNPETSDECFIQAPRHTSRTLSEAEIHQPIPDGNENKLELEACHYSLFNGSWEPPKRGIRASSSMRHTRRVCLRKNRSWNPQFLFFGPKISKMCLFPHERPQLSRKKIFKRMHFLALWKLIEGSNPFPCVFATPSNFLTKPGTKFDISHGITVN